MPPKWLIFRKLKLAETFRKRQKMAPVSNSDPFGMFWQPTRSYLGYFLMGRVRRGRVIGASGTVSPTCPAHASDSHGANAVRSCGVWSAWEGVSPVGLWAHSSAGDEQCDTPRTDDKCVKVLIFCCHNPVGVLFLDGLICRELRMMQSMKHRGNEAPLPEYKCACPLAS